MTINPWLMILSLAAALALVAGIAVALLFSIDAGRPSWVLAVILGIDSLALLLIGGRGLLRGQNRTLRARAGAKARSG